MYNIEIKAKIQNIDNTISKIKELTDNGGCDIEQHDIFYETRKGRLKLRRFKDDSAELIFYERPNLLGPKLSSYNKITLNPDTTESLANILSQSIGVFGTVNKIRHLYMVGQTRIHVDEVEGLGSFIEIEVVLKSDQDMEAGQKIAADLMQMLLIKQEDLIAEAYVDLLNKTKTSI